MNLEYPVIEAIVACCAGCLIRYINEYKARTKIKISYLILDLLTSAFLGYLTHWFLIESYKTTPSYAAVVSCIVGNLGSRIFDLINYFISSKLGLPKPTRKTGIRGVDEDNDR